VVGTPPQAATGTALRPRWLARERDAVSGPVPRLVLASASPARLDTLRRAGLRPEVVVSGVDEDKVEEPDPAAYALKLAQLKAVAVAATEPRALVIGCDSVLEFDGQILGKPGSAEEATERWQQMRGNAGVLHTGHCVIDTHREVWIARSAATRVRFAQVSDDEIAAYVRTGEPLKVAGAFTIDGLGSAFVSGVTGDPHNVVGISVPLLRLMFDELGFLWTDFWAEA
jgi:septum formation protein